MGYTQKFESWSPGSDNTWETKDLSGSPFSVPASAICEIVITVITEADQNAGVRAYGSSLSRYFLIHEAEAGGVDAVRMHVKADASSRIEVYGHSTNTVFYLVGYWDSGDYTELMAEYTSDQDDAWRTITVSAVPADKVAEVVMYNLSTTAEVEGGVRDTSSVLDRYFMLQESEPTAEAMDLVTMHVEVDGSQQIDVYSGNRFYVKFSIIGYWNTEPGTWNEKMYEIPANAGDAAWEDEDLSAQISASAICEIVNRNVVNNLEMEVGVRKKTSSDARFFDLHEAEQGGEDVVTLIVEADSSSVIQVYAEVAIKARHTLIGYWAVGGQIVTLQGSTAGQSGLSAAAKLTMKMSGSSGGASGVSAPLKATREIIGSIGGQSGADGATKVMRELLGSLGGQSSVSGLAKVLREIVGSVAGQSGAVGTLSITGEILLQGSTAGQSGADAGVKLTMKLAGDSAGESGTSSILKLTRTIAGTSDAQSVASAVLKAIRGVAGSVAAQSGTAGDVKVEWGLSGTIDGQSGASATPKITMKISGSVDAVSSLIGDLTVAVVIIGRTEAEITLTITTSVALDESIGTTVAMDRTITRTKEIGVEI